MKILDTETGRVHVYGTDRHDSLAISEDGKALHYYNLQCGDGSMFGTYRFVMDDGKIPAESQTEDAMYCECYFNIGGFHDAVPFHGKWVKANEKEHVCSHCSFGVELPTVLGMTFKYNFCPNCGALMDGKETDGT